MNPSGGNDTHVSIEIERKIGSIGRVTGYLIWTIEL